MVPSALAAKENKAYNQHISKKHPLQLLPDFIWMAVFLNEWEMNGIGVNSDQ
jgi:hypothetical protein